MFAFNSKKALNFKFFSYYHISSNLVNRAKK